ncbi:MAG: hypothetical protein ACI4M3_04025 [Acutalibacteraceae bacterium]
MKKIITSVLAATFALSATATAFAADTTITADENGEPNPSTGNTTVTYSVAPTYTVTIPEMVQLDTVSSNATVNEATIKAENVVVAKGKQVVVKLTGASGTDNAFTVATTDGEGAEITYTVKNGSTYVNIGDAVLTVNPESDSSGSSILKFIAPNEVKYAGTYEGTVTFTVSVDDVPTSGEDTGETV